MILNNRSSRILLHFKSKRRLRMKLVLVTKSPNKSFHPNITSPSPRDLARTKKRSLTTTFWCKNTRLISTISSASNSSRCSSTWGPRNTSQFDSWNCQPHRKKVAWYKSLTRHYHLSTASASTWIARYNTWITSLSRKMVTRTLAL